MKKYFNGAIIKEIANKLEIDVATIGENGILEEYKEVGVVNTTKSFYDKDFLKEFELLIEKGKKFIQNNSDFVFRLVSVDYIPAEMNCYFGENFIALNLRSKKKD